MTDLTRIWTRDGREWTVQGSADENWRKTKIVPSSPSNQWVEFRAVDGKLLRIRKDAIAAILPVS